MKVFFYWARLAWFIFLMVNIWFFGARARAGTQEVTFDQLFPQNSYERLLSLSIRVYHLLQLADFQHEQVNDVVQLLAHTITATNKAELASICEEDMDYLTMLIEHINSKCACRLDLSLN